jgi:hypothetical protein
MPYVPSGNYVNQFQEKINIKDMPHVDQASQEAPSVDKRSLDIITAGESPCGGRAGAQKDYW